MMLMYNPMFLVNGWPRQGLAQLSKGAFCAPNTTQPSCLDGVARFIILQQAYRPRGLI